jgi:hypothetical protein
LHHNYVEDDSEAFRFDYSPDFLAWALRPPGWLPEWHIGVRAAASAAASTTGRDDPQKAGRLVGFISAVPAKMGVNSHVVEMVEINFLCVHKKLRSKRLAPLLIREVTRRVNRRGIWQAAYTAGVVLPVPLAEARYWHRPLATRKLVDIGFSSCPPSLTLKAYEKMHRLPPPLVGLAGGGGGKAAAALSSDASALLLPGLRPFDSARDAVEVAALLGTYLRTGGGGGGGGEGAAAGASAAAAAASASALTTTTTRFRLAPIMNADEVAHWLGPREGVVESWVVERRVDDPAVLRLLLAAEEEEQQEEEENGGEEATTSKEERARRRARRAASRRAVLASRDAALQRASALGGDMAKAAAEAARMVGAAGATAGEAAASGNNGSGNNKKKSADGANAPGGSSPILFPTDLLSFYTIPSSVLNHPNHKDLRAAYGFYTVPGTHSPKALMRDALCLAKKSGHDVFNALELADGSDAAMLRDLRFGAGDGTLRYYLYNWRARGAPFAAADVGLVML